MKGEDVIPPPKMAVQKFSANLHKPVKIQCLKPKNIYYENLLHNVHFKTLLCFANISYDFS